MKELLRTIDPVRLSFPGALLRDVGVEPPGPASHMSVFESSTNEIPRRFALRGEDSSRARWVLEEPGERLDA